MASPEILSHFVCKRIEQIEAPMDIADDIEPQSDGHTCGGFWDKC
jgi:hypothetical protein